LGSGSVGNRERDIIPLFAFVSFFAREKTYEKNIGLISKYVSQLQNSGFATSTKLMAAYCLEECSVHRCASSIAIQLFVVELLCQDLLVNHGCVLLVGGLCPPLSKQ
jgi:hypothetical protein